MPTETIGRRRSHRCRPGLSARPAASVGRDHPGYCAAMPSIPGPVAAPRPPLPRHVQIEVTSACNLRCRMCLVRYAPAVNKAEGAIPYELFTKIVDDDPALEVVTLQGLGEPLLHPRIVDMVGYLTARGIRCGFSTNATL